MMVEGMEERKGKYVGKEKGKRKGKVRREWNMWNSRKK
jgi:hypothetical protein